MQPEYRTARSRPSQYPLRGALTVRGLTCVGRQLYGQKGGGRAGGAVDLGSALRGAFDVNERAPSMTAIRLEQVTKRYNATVALDAVDLSIHDGELFFLLGP